MNSDNDFPKWYEELDAAITVCDENGIIVYMNQKSIQQFVKYGGSELIGKNLLDCHPEPSKTKLSEMLEAQQSNIYSTEKNGEEKMVIQKPWTENNRVKGLVEISFLLPKKISNEKEQI